MRLVQVRSQGEHPPRGGGAQAVGADQRTVSVVSGKFAWQEAGTQATPNPGAAGDRLYQLWATPHGVIKAAMANAARVEGNTAIFTLDGREFKATLNAQNLVEKVAYLSTNEVVGDYPIESLFGLCGLRRRQIPAAHRADGGWPPDLGHYGQRRETQCCGDDRCPR
jgi:hypothetical protein